METDASSPDIPAGSRRCRSCMLVMPVLATKCPHCHAQQNRTMWSMIGGTIPLIATTVSLTLLVGDRVYDRWWPARAVIRTQPADPAYSLDEISVDLANLSDLTVAVPKTMICTLLDTDSRKTLWRFDPEMDYSLLTLRRGAQSAAGLRNESASVRYQTIEADWNQNTQDFTIGMMTCNLQFEDRHGVVAHITGDYAFQVFQRRIVFYDLSLFAEKPMAQDMSGLFCGARLELGLGCG